MKPVVRASIEDDSGDRCVDIIRFGPAQFGFRECRRDPEDGHGWRYLSAIAPELFYTEDAARQAATEGVGWMRA